ncbi:MAG: hypothetical protein ACTSP1_17945 [Candidatus Freyarchaeota archaeon]
MGERVKQDGKYPREFARRSTTISFTPTAPRIGVLSPPLQPVIAFRFPNTTPPELRMNKRKHVFKV